MYSSILTSLREFESVQYDKWGSSVESVSQEKLRQMAGGQWAQIQQLFPPHFPHDLLAAAA